MAPVSSNILHFRPISDYLAMGGQPKSDQFQLLKIDGYTVILQLLVRETGKLLRHEEDHVADLNIKHLTLSMSYATPTEVHIRQFFRIMDQYADHKMYVHDATGYCASALIALYLMRQGCSLQEARQHVLPGWQPNSIWQPIFERMIT